MSSQQSYRTYHKSKCPHKHRYPLNRRYRAYHKGPFRRRYCTHHRSNFPLNKRYCIHRKQFITLLQAVQYTSQTIHTLAAGGAPEKDSFGSGMCAIRTLFLSTPSFLQLIYWLRYVCKKNTVLLHPVHHAETVSPCTVL
jgi:hypothetical protein